MDLCGFVWKNIYYVPLLVELMLFNVLHLTGGETIQSRDSRKNTVYVPFTGKSNSSEDGQVPFSPISIQSSLALHYIDSVIKNPSKNCLYNRSAVTLDSYKLNIVNSSFCKLYKSHAKQVVWIARALTGLLKDHNTIKVANQINFHKKILYELLKSTFFDNTQIAGSGIAFDNDTFLYMAKSDSDNPTGFQNLSNKYNFTDAGFYSIPAKRNYTEVWNQRNESFDNMNIPPLDVQDGYWTDPYFDCMNLEKWIITYSVPFFHRPREKAVFSGVIMIDIDINQSDVNQCASDQQLFSESNKCLPETTQCVHIPGGGLRAGSYKCVCQKGFYFPDKNSTTKSFPGSELEQAFLNFWNNKTNFSNVEYQCLPCPRGCENCVDDTRCMAEYNVLLRGIPLGIQSFCITVTIVIGIVVLRLRKSKVMVASMWILLEMVLIGAVLLYATEFDLKKRTFEPGKDAPLSIKLPASLIELYKMRSGEDIQEVLKNKFDQEIKIKRDKLQISPQVFIRLFNKSISSIVNHIQSLLEKNTVSGVSVLLLVGGYAESHVVRDAIVSHFPNLQIIHPPESSSTVLKGAVLFGHDPKAIVARVCKYTYGIAMMVPYKEGVSDPSKKRVINGEEICDDVFDVHLRVGEQVSLSENRTGKQYNVQSGQTHSLLEVYASSVPNPKYVTENWCTRLGSLVLEVPPNTQANDKIVVLLYYSGTELGVSALNPRTKQETKTYFDFLG